MTDHARISVATPSSTDEARLIVRVLDEEGVRAEVRATDGNVQVLVASHAARQARRVLGRRGPITVGGNADSGPVWMVRRAGIREVGNAIWAVLFFAVLTAVSSLTAARTHGAVSVVTVVLAVVFGLLLIYTITVLTLLGWLARRLPRFIAAVRRGREDRA